MESMRLFVINDLEGYLQGYFESTVISMLQRKKYHHKEQLCQYLCHSKKNNQEESVICDCD